MRKDKVMMLIVTDTHDTMFV